MAKAPKKSKRHFDEDAYREIMRENSLKVAAEVYGTAVELALAAKYGPGIVNRAMVADSDVQAMREAMAPLLPVIDREAVMTIGRVMSGMLSNPNLREYFQKQTAANIGKGGGRRPRARAPHIEWLDKTMRRNQAESGYGGLTAKEHRQKLALHSEIVQRDDGHLGFSDKPGDVGYALGDSFISDAAIEKMLTFIKKNPF